MSKPDDIYCEQCRVRPREIHCDWCDRHICRCCGETAHRCNELNEFGPALHEIKQVPVDGRQLAPLPSIEISGELTDQLSNYLKKEEEIITNYYKEQADKLKAQHDELLAQNEKLNTKLLELEQLYSNELKNIADSYSSQAQNQVTEIEKNANNAIANMQNEYVSKIKALEEQNNALQASMADNLKKIQSPRKSTAVVPKVPAKHEPKVWK